MERNSLISAPQLDDVNSVFVIWEKSRFGSMGDRDGFYRFITEPSIERSQFIGSLSSSMTFDGQTLQTTIKYDGNES